MFAPRLCFEDGAKGDKRRAASSEDAGSQPGSKQNKRKRSFHFLGAAFKAVDRVGSKEIRGSKRDRGTVDVMDMHAPINLLFCVSPFLLEFGVYYAEGYQNLFDLRFLSFVSTMLTILYERYLHNS